MKSPWPEVTVVVDGSGGRSGPGGWGAVIRCGEHAKEISGAVDEATNNTMELTAAIMGLRALKRPCIVELVSDSEYVVKGATEWVRGWQARDWTTKENEPVKNLRLWQQLLLVARRHSVTWHWVKGHAGHVDNERADKLAGAARIERKALLTISKTDCADAKNAFTTKPRAEAAA